MAVPGIAHPTGDERRAKGKEACNRTPLSSHTRWPPAAGIPDQVGLLAEQNLTREPDRVPVRHGRMLVSPFGFYRGKDTPHRRPPGPAVRRRPPVQPRAFASPERGLLVDLNDFDAPA
jgi:hypothetical protein